jgi:hypothetical protein
MAGFLWLGVIGADAHEIGRGEASYKKNRRPECCRSGNAPRLLGKVIELGVQRHEAAVDVRIGE